jgi:histidine triad (HIT) family protein
MWSITNTRQYREETMDDCIFCQIIAGRSQASRFYEDEHVLGLMTIGPVNDGHAMIIPKQHVAALADLDEAVGRQLFTITQRTAAAIRASGLRCEGINLFLADGEAAFQEVFHLHMHIFQPPRAQLDAAAHAISQAYQRLFGRF